MADTVEKVKQIKNINRDYLVSIDVKNSSVNKENLNFYITDKKTSNIYVQLVINMSTNNYISKFVVLEEASNYQTQLNIVKPNNEPKTVMGQLLDEENAIFLFDLEDDCKDLIGKYKCEVYASCTVNNRTEGSTSDPFEYTVKSSIFNDLDEPIESDKDYPIILNLIEQIKGLTGTDASQFATKEYVQNELKSLNIDTTKYATKEELINALKEKAAADHTHDGLVATIGDGTDWHVLTFDDIPIDTNRYYYLNKVKVNYVSKGTTMSKQFDNEAVHIRCSANRTVNDVKYRTFTIYTSNSLIEFSEQDDGTLSLSFDEFFPTQSEVDNEIKQATEDFVTNTILDTKLADKADKNHTHSNYITNAALESKNYATESFVNDAIANASGSSGNIQTIAFDTSAAFDNLPTGGCTYLVTDSTALELSVGLNNSIVHVYKHPSDVIVITSMDNAVYTFVKHTNGVWEHTETTYCVTTNSLSKYAKTTDLNNYVTTESFNTALGNVESLLSNI